MRASTELLQKAALASTALALVAGVALAADLPGRRSPPPAPLLLPAFSWTGFHVGVNAGYGAGAGDRLGLFSATAIGSNRNLGNLAPRGGFGGIHAGYDYQFDASPLVIGAEADAAYGGLSKSISGVSGPLAYAASSKIRWDASLRLRGGLALGRFLVYTTGGVAFAGTKYSVRTTAPLASTLSSNSTRTGYTVGGGVEYAFTDNLIGGLEGRYTGLGRKALIGTVVPAGTTNTNQTSSFYSVAARLGYKF